MKESTQLCQIQIQNHLDDEWVDFFETFNIERFMDAKSKRSYTLLSGWIEDQSALHGLLNKIENLGLVIISIRLLAHPEWTQSPDTDE